jgi:glycosyltransferase involved in cell wall biosynthesis
MRHSGLIAAQQSPDSTAPPGKCDVAVLILTLNESANLPFALNSVNGFAREIVVIDSGSVDDTEDIAVAAGCRFVVHPFEDYASQRNFALDSLDLKSEWIFFLDADESLTVELKNELAALIRSDPPQNGFFVKWRMIWMGKWIRRGYYPTWVLRMFRRGKGRCEERAVNEHFIVDGSVGYLKNDFIHEDHKGLDHWLQKHVSYASREARELVLREERAAQVEIDARLWGTQAQRKRWLRYKVWNRLPALARPFTYFIYRLLIRGGILDGKEAVIYHFLHALWFPFLVDAKYVEMKSKRKSE